MPSRPQSSTASEQYAEAFRKLGKSIQEQFYTEISKLTIKIGQTSESADSGTDRNHRQLPTSVAEPLRELKSSVEDQIFMEIPKVTFEHRKLRGIR